MVFVTVFKPFLGCLVGGWPCGNCREAWLMLRGLLMLLQPFFVPHCNGNRDRKLLREMHQDFPERFINPSRP